MNIIPRRLVFIVFLSSCLPSFAQLNLEDIFLKGKYYPKTIGDIGFLHQGDGYILLNNTPKGQQILFYDAKARAIDSMKIYAFGGMSDLPKLNFESVEASNTDRYFLLKTNEQKMYRRAGAATYFIADRKGNFSQVSNSRMSFPQFSKDDTKMAYVRYNNLYWYDVAEKTEHTITTDGVWDAVINGKSDWVYEEEFEMTQAFAWSPDNQQIAYLKFDESRVKEYQLPLYLGRPYPIQFSYKYPKAGEENSRVSVWVYNVKKNKSVPIKLAGYSFEYIPGIYWNAGGNEIWIMLLNRHQDSLTVVAYNTSTKKIRTVYEDHSDTYVDVPFAFDILSDNSYIVNSERDGYDHLYHFDANGKLIRQLTQGNFDVTDYYGVDEKKKIIYFQSNENAIFNTGAVPKNREIFSVNYESAIKKALTIRSGTNKAQFSPRHNFYILEYSNCKVPPVISIRSTTTDSTIVLEENRFLTDSLVPMLPVKHFMGVMLSNADVEAYSILPNSFLDPDSLAAHKKHPVLFYVYGGPENQEVLDEWNSYPGNLWLYYMAQQGYVIECIDPRGSAGKGAAFKKSTYLNLGKYESEDYIGYARFLKNSVGFDSSRIGIYGASYGGYMAALCLLEGNDVFKTAVAQSPVTDWRFYDNIYTERYMRTPEENPNGYDHYNPVADAGKMKGNLLLIHGTADDNVHFQNTVEFINALNDAHKNYDLYLYPDKNHGIYGGDTRFDLYRRITQFLLEKL